MPPPHTANSLLENSFRKADFPPRPVLLFSIFHFLTTIPVWPAPRSLATTCGISVDFFSSPYLDVSVRAVPLIRLWIQRMMTGVFPAGFLHSDTHGSTPICGSPWLFAAYRVLRRLPVPRHPPCALFSLTLCVILLFSQQFCSNCLPSLYRASIPRGQSFVMPPRLRLRK